MKISYLAGFKVPRSAVGECSVHLIRIMIKSSFLKPSKLEMTTASITAGDHWVLKIAFQRYCKSQSVTVTTALEQSPKKILLNMIILALRSTEFRKWFSFL